MPTVGWLFLIVGGILIRQVARGRATNIVEDLGDGFVGVVTMDTAQVGEVVARTGEGVYQPISGDAISDSTIPSASGNSLLDAARARGARAKGYKFGTIPPEFGMGPNWYDCSGLVSKALGDIGVYKGGRGLSTYTWKMGIAKKIAVQVGKPAVGDIVVWQRGGTSGHMGIVSGAGKFYGAQSSSTGIKELPISNIRGSVSYWRLK